MVSAYWREDTVVWLVCRSNREKSSISSDVYIYRPPCHLTMLRSPVTLELNLSLQVLSVILHSGEGIPLRAFVKVPKLSDAHLAICKVHGKKIFNTQVTVNIATDKEKELCFLRCEVTSILKEAPLLFLPLNKFLSDYYEKCSRAFDMSCIGLIHDLVVVTGKPGNQAISLVTRAISAVKVSVDAEQFARDVHELLQSCEGAMPLVSIAASYWLKFDRKIEVREGGVVFADALSSVPNVKISDSLMVSWAQPAIRHGMFICFHKL